MRWTGAPLLLVASIALVGCTVDNPAFQPEDPVCEADEFFRAQRFSLADPDKVDILFVVDNSSGMLARQQALAQAMPSFVNQLEERGFDWQIGVISTDMSNDTQRGRLQRGAAGQAACVGEVPLVVTPQASEPASAAACNVVLGESGSDIEQGLFAALVGLQPPLTDEGGPNAGFGRDDARLVVIFFADEDDCSAEQSLDRSNPDNCIWQQDALKDANIFGSFFRSNDVRQQDGQPVSVVAIVGAPDRRTYARPDLPPSVCGINGPARPGTRYAAVAESLGTTGFVYNTCTNDYRPILDDIVEHAVDIDASYLCIGRNMTTNPVAVLLRSGDETVGELDSYSDYAIVGPTDACPNGVVAISPNAHGTGLGDGIEVRFCTDEEEI